MNTIEWVIIIIMFVFINIHIAIVTHNQKKIAIGLEEIDDRIRKKKK